MSYAAEVAADSPLAYWRLDDASGNAADSSGNGHTATASGGPTYSQTAPLPGVGGTAITFDGVDDGFANSDSAVYGLTAGSWSLEAIVKPDSGLGGAFILSANLDGPGNIGFALGYGISNGSAHLQVGFYNGAAGGWRAADLGSNYTAGVAQHVVGTYDGTNLRLYVNGSLVVTQAASGNTASTSGPMRIGRRWDTSSGSFFKGALDEVAVYNTVLSGTRIAAHYAAASPLLIAVPTATITVTAPAPALGTEIDIAVPAASLTVTAPPPTPQLRLPLPVAHVDLTASPPAIAMTLRVAVPTATITVTGPGVVLGSRVDLASWTLETSQSATRRRTGFGSFALDVAVAPIPDGVRAPFWKRVSPTMPTPVIANVKTGRPDPAAFTPDSVYRTIVGRPQTVVGGRDISFFRGFPVSPGWVDSKPFGPESATIPLQQISTLDELGTGDLSWCTEGAKVVIRQVDENGDPEHDPLFEGTVVTPRRRHLNRGSGLTLEVQGILRGAAQGMNQPHFNIAERDIGHVIANKFNQVVSRKFGHARRKTTGITTLKRGSRDDTVLGHAQDLLSTATIADGTNAWTVACDLPGGHPVIRLSDLSTDHWVITNGTPGITVELAPQLLARANVIYGAGTAPDGCHWGGLRFPNLHDDVSPDYPFASPTTVMSVGTTDAETLDGDGVSKWQRRMISLGYDVDIDGVYGSADAAECRRIQAARGILVDGIVGPQTWVTTFAIGSNVGDLSGAFFMPLAYDPRVMPRLYHPDGSDAGENPDYDESIPRIERFINFGENVKKHEGIRACEALLARNALPDLSGTVTFTGCDPENGHRRRIRSGQNIRIKHFEGGPVRVHVSRVEVEPGGRVTCTVDTQFRDLLDLASIAQRRRENSDPARRDGTGRRRSALTDDTIVIWDCENGAGVIPRIPVYSHLPVVVRIPAGQQGQIAKIRLAVGSGPFRNEEYRRRDDVPGAARFAFAIASDEIDPAQIMRIIGGSPLNSERPWTPGYYPLTDAGVFYAVGSSLQAGGYSPGAQDQGDPITGRLIDDAGVTYESWQPPWLWCLIVSDRSGWAEGRLYPGVQDL